ncbi:gluconate 2-dehydrogenase subunit 3 family protein [Sphingobium sp.]|uniref:gluconate 2-dehydrogenase subunit 3 family protein n=1 Tax=Sphingobium sp. TaxID=1912891 RepID=UPI0028BE0111|nr:gluconate 2-dehydrogenase subunit 3 family protein [Sphingobium sp.]
MKLVMTDIIENMPMAGTRLDRRAALTMGLMVSGALALVPAASLLSGCGARPLISGDHSTLVLILLGLVVPDTNSPGAGTMDNMAFVLKAVNSGLMNAPVDTLARLEEELDWRAGARFVDLPPDRREQIVVAHDKAVFDRPIAFPCPWFTTKALILMSYYTSEAGASQELAYELAPGRYDPDVPVNASWKPLVNDWAGNSIKKAIA